MKNIKLYIYGILAAITVSCSGNGEVSGNYLKVELNVERLLKNEVSVFDVVSQVDVVCLDDTVPLTYSVFNGSPWVDCSEDNLFVLDPQTFSVHVYDMKGGFVEKADLYGRGAGEYVMAQMLRYNRAEKLLEVLDPTGKIYRYTTSPIKFHSLVDCTGKGLLSVHYYLFDGENYILYSHREEEKLWVFRGGDDTLQQLGYRLPNYLRLYTYLQRPVFEKDGRSYVYNSYDGAVDCINIEDGKLERAFEWDFGKYQAQLADIPEFDSAREYVDFIKSFSNRKVSPFIDMKIAGDKIFANVIFEGGKIYSLIYDLSNSNSFFFEKTKDGMKFFHGNVLGNKMYMLVESGELPEFVNRNILDETSQKEYDKVMDTEGIAVVWYEL